MPNAVDALRRDQLHQLALNRSGAYGFLGTIYLEAPTVDLIRKLQHVYVFQSIDLLTPEFFLDTREIFKTIDDFLSGFQDAPIPVVTEELAVEFTRLLRGVKRNSGPLPPYESLHVEKRIWGDSTAEVLMRYRDAGVALPENLSGEPPDHVGFELDFMRFLCEKEAKIWKNGELDGAVRILKDERTFLREHLLNWVPRLCDMIMHEAKHGFYRGVAGMTKALIADDESFVESLLDATCENRLQQPFGRRSIR